MSSNVTFPFPVVTLSFASVSETVTWSGCECMPSPHTPNPGRLLNSSTRTRSLSSTTRKERGATVTASCASTSRVTPKAASMARTCRRVSECVSLQAGLVIANLRSTVSHLMEKVDERLADRKSFTTLLQPQLEIAAAVPDYAVDRMH